MRTALDFRNSNGDTNYPDSDAILPVADGEAANQTVLRRPTENVRNRSEVLRDYLQEHMLLQEMTPRLYQGYVYAMPCIDFGGAYPTGTGVFTTTTDLVISNLATPGGSATYPYVRSTQAILSVGTVLSNELVFTSVKKQWEGSSFPAADANNIAVEIVAGSSLTVTTKGATGNLNHIYITIVSGTTTCAQLIAAVTASSPANTLVTVALGSGSTGTNPAPLWGPPQWAGDYTLRFLKGGAPGTVHVISSSVLATFFAASVDNLLQVGDSLCVWYDKAVDKSSTGGRLQSTYENTNYAIPAGSLFNSRREPWKLPNSVPICKCVSGMASNGVLLFADGSYIQEGFPAALGADSFLLQNVWRGIVYPSGWGWTRIDEGVHSPPVNVKEALDNTDYQLNTVMTRVEGLPILVCGPGGDYTGTTAVQQAISALQTAGKGGVIYVRAGYYSFTTTQAIEYPIHIIGEGRQNTYILTTVASGAVMTYTVSDCTLQGITLQYSSGTHKMISTWQTQNLHIDRCAIQGTIETLGGGITADRLKVTNCNISSSGANCFELNGSYGTIQDCEITVSATSLVAVYVTAQGKHTTIERCKITVASGSSAFLGNPQGTTLQDLTIRDIHIICTPTAASSVVVDFISNSKGATGYYQRPRIENLDFEFSGTTVILSGLFAMWSMEQGKIDGVRMDCGNIVYHYGYDDFHGPIIVSGTGTVANIIVVNGKIPSVGVDGFENTYGAILTFLSGADDGGQSSLHVSHVFVNDMEESSPSHSGDSSLVVLKTWASPYDNDGTLILDDLVIDCYMLEAFASGGRVMVEASGTVSFLNCNFQDGYWTNQFYLLPGNVEPMQFVNCVVYQQNTDPFTNGFLVNALGTINFTGNTFMLYDCKSAGNFFSFQSGYQITMSGNTIQTMMTTLKGTWPYVFKLSASVYYTCIIGNSVSYSSAMSNLYSDASTGMTPPFASFATFNALKP